MCRLPGRSRKLLRQYRVPRSGDVIELRGHAAVVFMLFARGRRHAVTCNRPFRLAVRLRRSRLVSQSYIGKRAISEGDRRVIRKFVVFPLRALMLLHSSGKCPMDRWTLAIGDQSSDELLTVSPKCSNIARQRAGRVAEGCAARLFGILSPGRGASKAGRQAVSLLRSGRVRRE
jgi:hypothetical protein